jgi:hypothetical protein
VFIRITLTAIVVASLGTGCSREDAPFVAGPGDACPQGIDVDPVTGGWEPLDHGPTFTNLVEAAEFIGADAAVLPPELRDAAVDVEFSSFTGGGLVWTSYGVPGDIDELLRSTEARIASNTVEVDAGGDAIDEDPTQAHAGQNTYFTLGPYPREPGDLHRSQIWEITPPSDDPEFAPQLYVNVRGCTPQGASFYGAVSFGPEYLGDCTPIERRAGCLRLYQLIPEPSLAGEDSHPRRVRALPDGRLELRAEGIDDYAESAFELLRHSWNLNPADLEAGLPTDAPSTFDLESTEEPPLKMHIVFTPLNDNPDTRFKLEAVIRTADRVGGEGP